MRHSAAAQKKTRSESCVRVPPDGRDTVSGNAVDRALAMKTNSHDGDPVLQVGSESCARRLLQHAVVFPQGIDGSLRFVNLEMM